MGLFDGESSHYANNHRSHSYTGTTRGHQTRPTYSRAPSSIFGGSNHGGSKSYFGGSSYGASRSIFGGGGGSSYYKRRPRDGYVAYLMHRLQRMIKELWYYARRHPVKAFFAIVVPLLSAGGAVGGLLKGLGIRLPGGFMGETRRGGGGYYGSSGYGGSSYGGGGGWMGNAGSLMQVARAFM